MKVVEIFSSIQGEGANTGLWVTFVRLSHCNLCCSFCDTEFNREKEYSLTELTNAIASYRCKRIIWTGGEPTLQLTDEIVEYFHKLGYWQGIETNGTKRPPRGLDYITVSPKVSVHILKNEFTGIAINELRYPVEVGRRVPPIEELPSAEHYLLSPIFTGDPNERMDLSSQNLEECIRLIKEDPRWRLSIQLHKLLQLP